MVAGLNQSLMHMARKGWYTMVRSKNAPMFGQIIDGETTLEDIASTKEVGPQDKPLHDVVIESIDVEE